MNKILIIGRGQIAQEHAKAANELGQQPHIYARARDNNKDKYFTEQFNGEILYEQDLSSLAKVFTHVIIAVDVYALEEVLISCIHANFQNILVEKPGFIRPDKILASINNPQRSSNIYVAYNRRGFNSVELMRKKLQNKVILKIAFDFTELIHIVEQHWSDPLILENWTWLNSTHVFDLCEFISDAKFSSDYNCVSGQQTWNKTSQGRIISGKLSNGVPFVGQAAFGSGSRWSLDVDTTEGRYSLTPIEELVFYAPGQFKGEKMTENQQKFGNGVSKMGFTMQLRNFISAPSRLRTINEQMRLYSLIREIQNANI